MYNLAAVSISREAKPTTVKVITKFPDKFEEIPIDQLERSCQFSWIEGFTLPQSYLERIQISAEMMRTNTGQAALEAIKNPYRRELALYKIDDNVGYVVVYVGDKPIPKQTYLSFYAGELCNREERGDSPYASPSPGNNPEEYSRPEDKEYATTTSCIDAKNYGNISRFLPDLPYSSDLSEYEFASGFSTSSIMTANLDPVGTNISGLPMKLFRTNREIRKGDLVGYRYADYDYWCTQALKGVKRIFFSTEGQALEYGYRRKDTIDVQVVAQNKPTYSVFSVSDIYKTLSGMHGLEIIVRETGIRLRPSTSELEDALLRNHYCPQPPLPIQTITRGELVDNSHQRILSRSVNSGFKCFLRGDGSYIVDAIVTTESSTEANTVAEKLGSVGLFPRVKGLTVIVDGVNTKPIGDAVSRLKR